MTVEIILMNLSAEMSLVLLHNLPAKMDVVFPISGNAIQKMIVAMDQMKEIFVLKKLVLTSNLLVRELDIVFHNLGFAMVS
jgi:hypothetical protein